MKTIWKILKCALFLALGIVFLFGFILYTVELRAPRFLRRRLEAALSGSNVVFRVDDIAIRIPRRITLEGVRLLDRTQVQARPMLAASRVQIDLAPGRLPWSLRHLVRHVTVEDLSYPRLPEGYYVPDSVEFPGSTDFREKDEPLLFNFPTIDPFSVTLLRPDILSVRATVLEIPEVFSSPHLLSVPDLRLDWPDTDVMMSLRGEFFMDLDAQKIRGGVHGQARTANIRPMLGALEVSNSYPYIDGWTNVDIPVDAGCRFDVNLRNNDLHLLLNLHPTGGAYNGVPMRSANGNVDVRVFVRDTYQNARIVVGPLSGNVADGRTVDGTIVYENTNDVGYVHFDVASTTSLSNALAIADVLNDGTLDCLQPETPPRVTLKGILAVNPAYAATNDLTGTLAFDRGTFFSIPLVNASATYAVKGTEVTFANGRANARHGGTITGSGRISVPGFREENARFSVTVDAERVTLEDLADVFSFDLRDRKGVLGGHVELSGPLGSNAVSRLASRGHIVCRHGHLAQIPLFAALTAQLAKRVPGFDRVVNQTRASLDFTLENGLLRTDNLLVEGDVFSIQIQGSYSIPNDALDLAVHVQLMRKDQAMGLGKLVQMIEWPVTKLLLDFRITGSLENPTVKYVSILDRTLKRFSEAIE